MATAVSSATPSREDFAKMLEESFAQGSPQEGAVVKGTVVGIEKDVAVIDVGAKTEGRVALREFFEPGRLRRHPALDHPARSVHSGRLERRIARVVRSRHASRTFRTRESKVPDTSETFDSPVLNVRLAR